MTESEFLDVSDAVFAQIEMALDDVEFDVDTLRSGNVLEIEFKDGSKVIVNRHAANQEIWLAARNILGGLLTVWLGRRLPPAPAKPWLQRLQQLGPICLLLSWVPIIGDALCGLAGWLRWPWLAVTMYLSVGKILRYLAIYALFTI